MFPFTFNNKELEAIIKNEGLLYAVTSYTNGEPIEDKKIRQLWEKVYSDIHFLQDFLADGREVPGYIIYKNGKYVILADRGNSHVPLSKYGMDEYVKTKIHEPLMEILKRLGMDKSDYGKVYAHGGTTQDKTITIFIAKDGLRDYDANYSRSQQPKYKAGQTVYSHIKLYGPAFSGKIANVYTQEVKGGHFGNKAWEHTYVFEQKPKGVDYIEFRENELYPSLEAMKKDLKHYEQNKERYEKHGELFGAGGVLPTAWKRFLEWLNEKI